MFFLSTLSTTQAEYELTSMDKELTPILKQLGEWEEKHRK